MEFDVKKYSDAMDSFHMQMEALSDEKDAGVGEALSCVCRILRIAKVDINFHETLAMEKQSRSEYYVFYEDGEPDKECTFIQREMTGDGNTALYTLYKIKDGVVWTDEELKRVKVLQKCLHSYNGRMRLTKIAERYTFHDVVSGMYNLNYFMKHAGKLIAMGQMMNYGACYFNLRHFSLINQRYGRDRGTAVMMTFINRLNGLLGETEIISRIGGDNFIILFLKEHLGMVSSYLDGTDIKMDFMREPAFITTSAGYYMVDEHCTIPTDLMDYTSVAVNVARNSMVTSKVFYDEKLVNLLMERKRIETIFPNSMRDEEFKVYYQPKISMKDYSLKGAEALCRWFHEDKLVPPNSFIPVLEQTSQICELDFYMLDHVCADIHNWLAEGKSAVKVSVNLSRRHFGTRNLLKNILNIIDSHDVPHEYIEIELTETTTDVGFGELRELVTGLRDKGISTSVDDFGVGYSSFNLIRDLPWNVIKIDKSFIDDVGNNTAKRNLALLKYIIAIAHELEMETICEGVETLEQIGILKEYGCYMAQGFYFDRPLPKEEFEKRIAVIV